MLLLTNAGDVDTYVGFEILSILEKYKKFQKTQKKNKKFQILLKIWTLANLQNDAVQSNT